MSSINHTSATSDPINAESTLSMADARRKLAGATGRRYWRSLEEMSTTPGFQSMVELEFPKHAAAWDPVNRRDFIRLMGASLALGGLTACTRQPVEKIIPYVKQPEEIVPGKPLFYATAMTLGGYGYGLLLESHMGRPTKAEGNPEHPASLGAADIYGQASVLELYDPDRSQAVRRRGRLASWDAFSQEISEVLAQQSVSSGAHLRILSESVSSPSLIDQMKDVLDKYPRAQWVQYEPVNRDHVYAGAVMALGSAVDSQYKLDSADVIVSLDADFLGQGPGHLRYARDFGTRRKASSSSNLNRLYVVETGVSMTGASADHRLAVASSKVEAIARAMAKELGLNAAQADVHGHEAWIKAVVDDLKAHRGSAVVIPGDHQPAVVHALAHAINEKLGAFGKTVIHTDPAVSKTESQVDAIKKLTSEMSDGKVEVLIILGGNPVVNAPVDAKFTESLEKVGTIVRLGLYEDETSRLAHWHLPSAHFLEAWSDVRAYDGTVSIVQPLIEPIYSGKSTHEVVAGLLGRFGVPGYEIVTEYWKKQLGSDYDATWRRALHDGLIAGSASAAKTLSVTGSIASEPPAVVALTGALEITILPDFGLHDGRFANNGWLQELPRPLTTLTWDNALLVNSTTADQLGIKNDDIVTVSNGEVSIEIPVLVTVGIANDSGVLTLGYGRTQAGRVGTGVGSDVYPLRTSNSLWSFAGTIKRTGGTQELTVMQEHHTMQGRHHFRSGTLAEFKHQPDFVTNHEEFKSPIPTIYPGFDYSKGPQWGMVIDLSACIGCNACMIACQAENNIPVVGRDQIRRGRDMYWIRVDRYYEGTEADTKMHHQPVTCMHCENAPCEAVCPVAATTHSTDGINQMVYNRCVGTRYCANNCPYKVRRFNFYKFADHDTPSLKLQRNPDVTVRARGVMEKCTYCIQRIASVRIDVKRENRPIRDGEVVTACQQACPTQAIVFGDIRDPESQVSKLKVSPLNYAVLSELATYPRTTYLARVTNPNPALEPAAATESHGHGV